MPKRKCKFTNDLGRKYPAFKEGRNKYEAECKICTAGTYVSVANKGSQDLEHHIASHKHKKSLQCSSSSTPLEKIFLQQESTSALAHRVLAAEGGLAFHTVRHHFSYRSMDCTPKLNQVIYSDSDIAKKVSTGRTKTQCIINNVIAPHSLDVTIQCLKGISCFGVSTDGSNHGCMKMFPILIQYYDYKVGGIKTKVIELKTTPNEKAETITSYVKETLENLGLSDKCVAFAGDNTNTNFGGVNRREGKNIYSNLKKSLNENLLGVGCPAHILHNAVQHGADNLSIDIECIILKMYNYFSIYTVRTEELKSFCEFVDINYKQLLSHSKTRWLSLFPAIERVLEMFTALKSYFLSQPKPPKILIQFFENRLSKAYLLHLHSIMGIFHSKIQELEKEQNSVLEIIDILSYVCQVLTNRLEGSFLCLKVREIIESAEKDGFVKEVEQFMKDAMLLYESCVEYIQKWSQSFDEFKCFKWMNLTNLKYSDVEECMKYLGSKAIHIDDVKCFDQFCNLKQFVSGNPELQNMSCNEKWTTYFQSSKSSDCHSELLKIAEYFFSIPGHNANVERIFSLISTQWTDERNRLSVDSVKGLIMIQYNFKEYSCIDFYDYLLKTPKLLEKIRSSDKYV